MRNQTTTKEALAYLAWEGAKFLAHLGAAATVLALALIIAGQV